VIQAFTPNRPDHAFDVRIVASCQMHLMQTVHHRFG